MAPHKKKCSPEERLRLDANAAKRRQHRLDNPEQTKLVQDKARKKFYKTKKHKVLQWNREHRSANYKAYLERTRVERKRKRLTSPCYVIKDRLRARLRKALKRKGVTKIGNTFDMIGRPPAEILEHLGAIPKGSEIDHIFPFDLFDLNDQDDILRVMHWSNLQILTESENGAKSAKLPTKAMADKTNQFDVWPKGMTWDRLPDIYPGWTTSLRMQ